MSDPKLDPNAELFEKINLIITSSGLLLYSIGLIFYAAKTEFRKHETIIKVIVLT